MNKVNLSLDNLLKGMTPLNAISFTKTRKCAATHRALVMLSEELPIMAQSLTGADEATMITFTERVVCVRLIPIAKHLDNNRAMSPDKVPAFVVKVAMQEDYLAPDDEKSQTRLLGIATKTLQNIRITPLYKIRTAITPYGLRPQ